MKPLTVVAKAKEGIDYSEKVNLTIKYTDTDNQTSVLHSGQITLERMKYTVLNISMSSNPVSTNSCVLSMEDLSITDGNSLNLEL